MLGGAGRDRRVGQPQQLVRSGRRGVGGDEWPSARARGGHDTKRGCARPPKSAPRSARGELRRADRRARARLHAGQPGRAAGGGRVRLPALLRRQPAPVPGARGAATRASPSRADRARRRPAHRPARATASTATARWSTSRPTCANLARRPGGVPDRLLVHVRAGAAGRRAARPPHRAGRERADVPDRRRLPPGRPLRRAARGLDAADDAAAGGPRDRRSPRRYPRPRRAGARRRPGARSASPTLGAPDYGDPVEIRDGEVPVFWACGVTPQAVAAASRPELMITHAPGHMFVTDLRRARSGAPVSPCRRAASTAGRRTRTRARRPWPAPRDTAIR